MIKVLDNDPSVGVVGPSTSRTSTFQTVRRAELCSQFWTDGQIDAFAFRYTTRNRGFAPVEMGYVGGFAFVITRSAWKASGGFDPALTGYGNEVDLCQRLRKHGFRCVWTKESYIHHFGESSFQQYFTSEELRNQRKMAQRFIDSKH
jgi:GT2 family glycosyltransferase